MNTQSASTDSKTSMSTVFSYAGFGIAMILMFAYIPTFDSSFLNFAVGAGCGMGGSVIGGVIGSFFDKES